MRFHAEAIEACDASRPTWRLEEDVARYIASSDSAQLIEQMQGDVFGQVQRP